MKPLGLDPLFRLIHRAYSGHGAKKITADLYQHCRRITHSQYEKAMRVACGTMKAMGFDDVELLRFPSDGKRLYGNWKTPRIWNVVSAYLDIRVKGKWARFADYRKIPTSLFVYSAPTKGEIKTTLVGLNAAKLKGCLVFCDVAEDGQLLEGRRKAEDQGARGIVTDFAPDWEGVRSHADFRNGHRWDNATLFEAAKPLAGFSLSRDQGDILRRALLEEGALDCRYRISGSLGKGELFCATGCVKGTSKPDDEAVVVAHLYEAGANDNCSGAAAAIEALHAIKKLVKQKRLAPPERTIRVVFAHEIVGFLAYFESIKKFHRCYFAGVNPDMVGEDQKKCRSVLNFYQSPHSMAGFTDPLLLHFIRCAAGKTLNVALKKFIINDNIVSDPAIGVPCPALIHLRDRFYHSNEDGVDKVSPDTLRRTGSAMAAQLYASAAMNAGLAAETAELCVDFSAERLKQEEEKGLGTDKLQYLAWVEEKRLISLEVLSGTSLDRARKRLSALLWRVKTRKPPVPVVTGPLKDTAGKMVPLRTVIGPMTFQHIPERKRRRLKIRPHWDTRWNLPLFWVNGSRNLFEIYQLATFESGPYDLGEFIDYFRFLKKESLIGMKTVRRG